MSNEIYNGVLRQNRVGSSYLVVPGSDGARRRIIALERPLPLRNGQWLQVEGRWCEDGRRFKVIQFQKECPPLLERRRQVATPILRRSGGEEEWPPVA